MMTILTSANNAGINGSFGFLGLWTIRNSVTLLTRRNRIHELSETRHSSRYAKQKSALELELSSFLSSLETPKDLSIALPEDVVAFLVWKDQGGRTVIHDPYCSFAGNSKAICSRCPKRLAYGTVDSLIGKIRALFVEAGSHIYRGGEWHSLLGVGNPAADRSVKNYLADVREEQLKAHIMPHQAEPVLLSDLEVLSSYWQSKLRESLADPLQLYLLARDPRIY